MAVTYREAGVDIEEGNRLVDRIKPFARSATTEHVLSGIGGFAGLCGLPSGLKEPVLVSGTDGVGTKLKVAFAMNRHDTIGQDLVAMCVNDIITTGAQPLFFLDYFGTGKLSADVGAEVIKGIADGCKMSGCALLGGETAELPGMYAEGEYDLAGFAVGVAERSKLLSAERVKEGDLIIGIASVGIHSNGYSLARHVLENVMKKKLDEHVPEFGCTLGEELLRPTRIYAATVRSLTASLNEDLRVLCHITGGGIPENLPRVLPEGTKAHLDGARPWPAVFRYIADGGPVELKEMRRTFNLGVGMVAVVSPTSAEKALSVLKEAGEDAWLLGRITGGEGAPSVIYENDPEGHRK
jgi:phosphoribosylformylglycinamidine cyclo-ligase